MEQILKLSEELNVDPFGLEMAEYLDKQDPLKEYRDKFHIPIVEVDANNNDEIPGKDTKAIYMCGNSLGLQPKTTRKYIEEELTKWEKYGVEGQFCDKSPWVTFDEVCVQHMAEIVGAKQIEVALMNSLTVNLHLMFTSFYTPTQKRYKVLMEDGAFPSDTIAVVSHIKFKGFDPDSTLLLVKPREGEEHIREEDIYTLIDKEGDEIALVFLGGVNYLTGQVFDMENITKKAKSKGCMVGLDLAHGVGNIKIKLNEWGTDFAVWCTYKYLNSGPGGIGGCFVHERYARDFSRPRIAGWWSHDKTTRFLMKPDLILQEGAFGFQISNPPILCLASLKASLELYHEVGMDAFTQKSNLLTGYMAMILDEKKSKLSNSGTKFNYLRVTTPIDPCRRGCQLTLMTDKVISARHILDALKGKGIIGDFREPNCIRVAPNPFYNTFMDVYNFVQVLTELLNNN